MAEMLQVIETLRAEEASLGRLFGGEGQRMKLRNDAPWLRKVGELLKVLSEAQTGDHRAQYVLREAMTTSDFPQLFGDVLQRQLLGTYAEVPATYTAYARVGEVPDFRSVKRFAIDGAEAVLPKVPELTQYPEKALSDLEYTYRVEKYGRRVELSWEALINDDLGGFAGIGARLARGARRTEERFATTLFVDANGPHASLYSNTNKNIVNMTNGAASNNPALSITALQQAMIVLSKQVDADGEPIVIDTVHLVVPPGLEITAQNILNALQLELTTEGGGTSASKLIAANWMRSRTQLHVNYYIPSVASTANGNTSWFLFASPTSGRPAIEVGFLRGNREPALFRKVGNQERVGGGPSGFEDFETDDVQWKVRHVMGGTRLDPKATVASNGSGS